MEEPVSCDHPKQRFDGELLPCSLPFCIASPDESMYVLIKTYPGGAIQEIEFVRCVYETAGKSHYFFWALK